MRVNMRLYATQQYLDRFGVPESINALNGHRIISQSVTTKQVNESASWITAIMNNDSISHTTVNSYFGVLQSTLSHVGIGVLPDYVLLEKPELIRVLPNDESQEIPVYLAYPEELRHSKRLQAFRDFVLEEIKTYRQDRDSEDADL